MNKTETLGIFLIKRIDEPDYDQIRGMVIIARDEEHAIDIARSKQGWANQFGFELRSAAFEISRIGVAEPGRESGHVLIDFLNG